MRAVGMTNMLSRHHKGMILGTYLMERRNIPLLPYVGRPLIDQYLQSRKTVDYLLSHRTKQVQLHLVRVPGLPGATRRTPPQLLYRHRGRQDHHQKSMPILRDHKAKEDRPHYLPLHLEDLPSLLK